MFSFETFIAFVVSSSTAVMAVMEFVTKVIRRVKFVKRAKFVRQAKFVQPKAISIVVFVVGAGRVIVIKPRVLEQVFEVGLNF